MNKTTSTFALTAATLFATACGGSNAPAEDAASTSAGDTVKCMGIHACKGQSQCGVPGGHSCAGLNDCKGKGWIKVSEAECAEKGGTVL
jgi:uncharacterized membrane protein